MIPCKDCPQRYIGQTSKKIETRITEHKNAIKRHDLRSLPAVHTYDNCHTFAWTKTELLGRAQTKHAREFKEAWFSTDDNTINRHIDIPAVYHQLKTERRNSINYPLHFSMLLKSIARNFRGPKTNFSTMAGERAIGKI